MTPQHFSITEQMIFEQGTNAKLNPPLRRTADIGKIIEGLKDGTIDVIATDHALILMKRKMSALIRHLQE